ncbi:hypothetical protein WL40_33870 [Burkholderia ubonensis]|uniref:DUF4280 domain-containing protein n=1 Tax=Burkholderia ubonensis TaxID=101571 RepID=A0ABD6Q176_9BURK|nr:DUF4280 domain-containing protein [Burkholderia ubonensis]MXN73941.1 DUF4280 domain-containing protein [Burkholderia sp. 4701]MXN81053.1 DUF4280 domain-containing protein [Burkholderia sp. 4812]RQS16046.1 DUF4280 domain-containing protein [Burkholderia sp. Bp9002]KVO16967.1 hypothetical protein WJ73_08220 [Burkholderia ubonensis]KVP52937.1 hypothetical protein WJ92_16915 [Burkholderia ubonensis]
MSQQVVLGAMLNCTFGAAPATLVVAPVARVMVEGRPAATVMDSKPLLNIPTFAMCSSPANPAVAAATAAAMGVLTPMPCVPAIAAPWVPGAPTVLIGGQPALNNMSKCVCNWGGVISINFAGSVRTMVP